MPLARSGNEYGFAVPANVFACRDGHVYLGVLLDAQWQELARLMGQADLATHADYATAKARTRRRDDINRLVADWVRTQPIESLLAQCQAKRVPIAPVRTYADAARDPHVQARDMLQNVEQEEGSSAPITGPAVKFSRAPARIRAGAPALGAHTDEILREVGIKPAEIASLRERGIA